MSHGQSQIVIAATLLHKAMEYETALRRRISSRRRRTSTCPGFFSDVYFGICKHELLVCSTQVGDSNQSLVRLNIVQQACYHAALVEEQRALIVAVIGNRITGRMPVVGLHPALCRLNGRPWPCSRHTATLRWWSCGKRAGTVTWPSSRHEAHWWPGLVNHQMCLQPDLGSQ